MLLEHNKLYWFGEYVFSCGFRYNEHEAVADVSLAYGFTLLYTCN